MDCAGALPGETAEAPVANTSTAAKPNVPKLSLHELNALRPHEEAVSASFGGDDCLIRLGRKRAHTPTHGCHSSAYPYPSSALRQPIEIVPSYQRQTLSGHSKTARPADSGHGRGGQPPSSQQPHVQGGRAGRLLRGPASKGSVSARAETPPALLVAGQQTAVSQIVMVPLPKQLLVQKGSGQSAVVAKVLQGSMGLRVRLRSVLQGVAACSGAAPLVACNGNVPRAPSRPRSRSVRHSGRCEPLAP